MPTTGDKMNPSNLQEAMKLAQTPAGQQLLQMLHQSGGDELQTAMSKAASGDYTQAKQAISALLSTPEVKKILEQLGGQQ